MRTLPTRRLSASSVANRRSTIPQLCLALTGGLLTSLASCLHAAPTQGAKQQTQQPACTTLEFVAVPQETSWNHSPAPTQQSAPAQQEKKPSARGNPAITLRLITPPAPRSSIEGRVQSNVLYAYPSAQSAQLSIAVIEKAEASSLERETTSPGQSESDRFAIDLQLPASVKPFDIRAFKLVSAEAAPSPALSSDFAHFRSSATAVAAQENTTAEDAAQGDALQQPLAVQLVQYEEPLSTPPSTDQSDAEQLAAPAPTQSRSCQQLFQGAPAIDNRLANDLNVDTRPIGRDKANNATFGQIIPPSDAPENLAAKKLGSLRDARYVGVGCSRFQTRSLALWAAPNFYHQPLYFEQPNLERYGHYVGGNCIQSAVSAAHFFGTIPLLPYKLGANPPLSCDYTLGRNRPGNCTPHRLEKPELSLAGVLNESLFVTGVVFFVP